MKVLVIGLNPSGKSGLKSPTLKTLSVWLDELGLKHVSFTNIYDRSGSFSLNDIKYKDIRAFAPKYDRVLALGNKVSYVLDLMGIEHFKLPHPSGLNRQLNNQKFVHEQLSLCKNYLYAKASNAILFESPRAKRK